MNYLRTWCSKSKFIYKRNNQNSKTFAASNEFKSTEYSYYFIVPIICYNSGYKIHTYIYIYYTYNICWQDAKITHMRSFFSFPQIALLIFLKLISQRIQFQNYLSFQPTS